MRVYQEDEEGWSFETDIETGEVIPGEFRFITFAGSPSVEYTSGGFKGARSYTDQDFIRRKFLSLGFKEVDHEPQGNHDSASSLTREDAQWLSEQLSDGTDYIRFGTAEDPQFLFSLTAEAEAGLRLY
jgi:hypothetical protein